MKKTIATALLAITVQAQANLKAIQAEMNAFQKPQVDAFRKVLEAEPEYKVYLSELKDLANIKDIQQKTKMAIAVNDKHKALFDMGMKKSKANPESTRKFAKSLEKKYSQKHKIAHIETGLYMTYKAWLENREQEQPPEETEVTFSAPFSFEHSSITGDGSNDINLDTGRFAAGASAALAGSTKNKMGLGDYIRVPWATETIRVSAKLPRTYVGLTAFAGLGGSAAAGSSLIDVLTEDGVECLKTQEHGVVVAPVVWHSDLTIHATTIMACEMEAPPANQDVAVRFQNVADVTTGGLAFAVSIVQSKPDPIRVRLIQ